LKSSNEYRKNKILNNLNKGRKPCHHQKYRIAVAYGDGIGPEIMEAVLHVLEEAGAPLEYRKIEIGEKVYSRGHPTGIEDSSVGCH
jgi:isocitrate dehydrogenase